jgi:lipoyl(octanoyl) transferase
MGDPLPIVGVRRLEIVPYETVWQDMRRFVSGRNTEMPDELWCVQHSPVFTLGMTARREHIRDAGGIPVIVTDRGGNVTYHGPGQLLLYPLLDLRRVGLGARQLIRRLEQAAIATARQWDIDAYADPQEPGVFVAGRKLASIGLRVQNGRSYHGLALNVCNDLAPFSRIDPCGKTGLRMTRLRDYAQACVLDAAARILVDSFMEGLATARKD